MEGQSEHGGVHCDVDGNGLGKFFLLKQNLFFFVTNWFLKILVDWKP